MTSRLYLAQVRLLCIVVLGIHLAPVSGLPFATTVPARLIAEQRALADPVHAFYTFPNPEQFWQIKNLGKLFLLSGQDTLNAKVIGKSDAYVQ